jgi:tRNA(Met) cytidine acetyltransferase
MMAQRQCIFLKGDTRWCHRAANTLLADFEQQNTLYLSQQISPDSRYKTIPQKQAQQQLGKEFDAVVFDATDEFNADSFGAIVGTIRAGGALVMLLPDTEPDSLWLQRFNAIAVTFCFQHHAFYHIEQGDPLPTLTIPPSAPRSDDVLATSDQTAAIDAILHVVSGHRRRPLVLTSDRGRGKSAALGMAAAELIKQGKQSIIVTAPSLATVASVFEHASRLLPEAKITRSEIEVKGALIRFIAPDALLESDIKADLVLVDEAAAIPAMMLRQLLTQYSRIVFASTLHGYEGTGLGFAIRFKHTLDNVTPNWRSVEMTKPIRWADDDVLEAFCFKALLLNAEPANATVISNCQLDELKFECVDRYALVRDEKSLSELFGLMVLAHYRTRPSDLQMMLDRDDISVFVMRVEGHIVASAWCVTEGKLDAELAEAVYAGERRLKGHLLPQSLLAHAGLVDAGALAYQRIIRLAVHPELQRQGIGQSFVRKILADVEKSGADLVGASFASSADLIGFWSQCGFSPMRLGLHHDEVSGSRAMMMLGGLSADGRELVNRGVSYFSQQWPVLLQQQFTDLSVDMVMAISQLLEASDHTLSQEQHYELAAFAFRQRSFESCQLTLWQALCIWLSQPKFTVLTEHQQALCIQCVIQQQPIKHVAKHLGFTGRAQLVEALRASIGLLL